MARPQADDYDDKRRGILDAAANLFAKVGYGNASMIDIARACKLSKSNLYHYFPAKEDLLFELIREHTAGNLAALEEVVSRPGPAEDRLRAFVSVWVQRALSARAQHHILIYDVKFLPRRQKQVIVELERRMIARLGELAIELHGAQDGREDELGRFYALVLFGMLNSTEVWFRSSGPMTGEELAQRLSRLILRGLAARK